MSVSATRLAEMLLDSVDEQAEQLGHFTDIELVCSSCAETATLGRGQLEDVEAVRELIEHTQHDHASRGDILIRTTSRLLTDYEVTRSLGQPARTEAEEIWRMANPV